MEVRWKLRMAAAQREVWTGAQLRRLLAERAGVQMSAASVSALMRQAPKQLKLSTLAGLCVALDCQPGELIEVDTTPVAKPATHAKPAGERAARGRRRSPHPPALLSRCRVCAVRLRTGREAARPRALHSLLLARQARRCQGDLPRLRGRWRLRPDRAGLALSSLHPSRPAAQRPSLRRCRRSARCAVTPPTGCAPPAISATPRGSASGFKAPNSASGITVRRRSVRSPTGCWTARAAVRCGTCAASSTRSPPVRRAPPR